MFLSSLFLIGLAAVGIPVIIHLMHSTKAEVIRFSSIRFLKNCQRRSARRTKLKQLLLMALRMLLLALVVLGMAKPVIQTDKTSKVKAGDSTSMILIIDNSYSMGYREEGQTRLEHAKQVAQDLLDTLKEGDEAAVIVVNDAAESLNREFSLDITSVKNAVSKIELSTHGTEMSEALSMAYANMRKSKKARREIHLLTDLQSYSWDKLLETNFIRQEEEPRPHLYISCFGKPKSFNTFIQNITVSGAAAGVGGKITAEVKSVGSGNNDNVMVLSVNTEKREQTAFTVRPGSPVQVPVEVTFDKPDTYRCSLALLGDSLPVDDTYDFTLTVDDRMSVLLVDGDWSDVPQFRETFYLNLALNPSMVTGRRIGSEIEPTVITSSQLETTNLEPYKCIILCNVPVLSGNEQIQLEAFLNSGGSVIMFLGDRVQPVEYNKLSFLPATLNQVYTENAKPMSFGRVSPTHAIFSELGDFRTAKVFRAFSCQPRRNAEVLAELKNGMPVIIEGSYGSGRVLMFGISADLGWSNLPLRKIYLALMHNTVNYMCGRKAMYHAYRVGDAVEFRALAKYAGQPVVVTTPKGKVVSLPTEVQGSYAVAKFTDTSEPGRYKVKANPDFSNSSGFSVNPDVRESDLSMIMPQKLQEQFEGMNVTVLDAPGKLIREVTEKREGWKLWPLLFKLALLIFCIEILVANLFSRTVEYGGVKMQWFDYLKLRRGGGLEG